jgi:hypothetical protein
VRVLKSLIEGMFLRALACLLKLRWASILQRLLRQKVLTLWAKQHAVRGVAGYTLVVALVAMLSWPSFMRESRIETRFLPRSSSSTLNHPTLAVGGITAYNDNSCSFQPCAAQPEVGTTCTGKRSTLLTVQANIQTRHGF